MAAGSPAGVRVSLRQPPRDRSRVAGPGPHGLPLPRMGSAGQLPSRRDMDLSLAQAPDHGADAGLQGSADNPAGLEAHEETEKRQRSQVSARDEGSDTQTRSHLPLVGAGEIIICSQFNIM